MFLDLKSFILEFKNGAYFGKHFKNDDKFFSVHSFCSNKNEAKWSKTENENKTLIEEQNVAKKISYVLQESRRKLVDDRWPDFWGLIIDF